jgi:hypothetical protein
MDDNKVAVLLEDLRAQFRTFGEGLQLLNDKVDNLDQKVVIMDSKVNNLEMKLDAHIQEDRQEHQQLMQMIKELDTEVIQLKRVK